MISSFADDFPLFSRSPVFLHNSLDDVMTMFYINMKRIYIKDTFLAYMLNTIYVYVNGFLQKIKIKGRERSDLNKMLPSYTALYYVKIGTIV